MSDNLIYYGEEAEKYQVDISNPFHNDDLETFEIYECCKCHGHFLVESDGAESVTELFCPYCKEEFKYKED